MKLSAILEPLLRARVDPDVILDAVRAFEAQAEAEEDATKEKARARWRKWKASQTPANVSKRLQPLANDLRAGVTRVEDNLQTKNQAGEKGKEEKDARDAHLLSSFPEFWSLYPNKVGKRDAEKAFAKAIQRADLETIMAGLRRYVAKTDDRPWCNPATWLNQDRWEDQPAAAPSPRAASPPGKQSIGQMFQEEARRAGLIDEPSNESSGRLEDGNRGGQAVGAGRFGRDAIEADFRRLG